MAENPPSPPASSSTGDDASTANGAGSRDTPSPGGTAPDESAFPEGVPCWADVQLPDLEAGKRFYGGLFGWTFEELHASSVWACLDGAPVAALVRKWDGRMPTVWTVYFATPDATALAGRIQEAGGQVIVPPTPVGRLGMTALTGDPEGAVFGLWQAGTHPGFGKRHAPGCFTWSEVYTRDADAANAFYSGLFPAPSGPSALPDFGCASIQDVFPAEMPPHFLLHFAVKDRAAAIDAVGRLGGRVQVPPFEAWYGRVAVVTDNQGASFALLQR
ncbi:VOC family protein [Streptomyces sp. NPDC001222]|uniref:VOC family protein n=1 Tax=Streptomyces sp. NPDC001222 TaxID=3364548 RepID=UPI0036C7C7BB